MVQASKEMPVFFWHKLWKIKITPFMWELHVQTRTRTNHNVARSAGKDAPFSFPFRVFLPLPLPSKAKHSFYLIGPFKSA